MWQYLVRLILTNRPAILIIIGLITIFMAYEGSQVKMSYEMARMLPKDNPYTVEYDNFKEQFGQDGSVIFVAIQDPELFTLKHFDKWYDLSHEVNDIHGVDGVISVARIFALSRNDSLKKFDFLSIVPEKPKTQPQLDSLREIIYNQMLYDGRLFNKDTDVSLMMITLDKDILNSKDRVGLVEGLVETIDQYGEEFNLEIYYSGLPYIRTVTSKKVQNELLMFIFLSLFITSVLLFILFRTARAVLFAMIVVIVAVIWAVGFIVLFGYKITILTGIIPPLIIVIGVENSIFLLNKYLSEYRDHGNKVKALSRMITRIGNANLLTNATTAAGFAAFIITSNEMLIEFGIIASINILVTYLLSLLLLPILFSFFPVPKTKHMKHLEQGWVKKIVDKVTYIVMNKRPVIYVCSGILLTGGVIGLTLLKTTGNVVDDISRKDKLYKDMIFLEKNFKGVMPLEISIDTKKKNGIMSISTMQKIERLQDTIATYAEFSKPVSVVEVVKSAKQAFYRGNPKMYELPNNQEKNFILSYVPELNKSAENKKSILDSFIDSTYSKTRISVQMANIGTNEIEIILNDLQPKVDSIFPPDKFEVHLTGTSVVFLKGTDYLVKNLFMSLALALVIITLLMAAIFSSVRMILISLVPNIIPQIMTAGMMGYFDISIKPSTILIFSIALGISVDNTIHFLSRYRLQLKQNNWRIQESVLGALDETSYSMIYSAIVLFFGFFIFTLSSFGGTEALGYLVSFTLVVALFSNLFVLPSMLLTLGQKALTKAFRDQKNEKFDEEKDAEIEVIIKEELHINPDAPDKYTKI